MSYTGIGDTSTWLGILASTSEVYLLRVRAKGLEPKSPLDLLEIARAVGQAKSFQTKIDVRGVALWQDGDDAVVDVVFTSPESGVAVLVQSASGLMSAIASDAQVVKLFPGAVFHDPSLLQLTGPPDSVDHWRQLPIVWDHSLTSPGGNGGPTSTFVSPDPYTVVLGKADDGAQAKPWVLGSKPRIPGGSWTSAYWVVGIGAAAIIAYQVAKKRKRIV